MAVIDAGAAITMATGTADPTLFDRGLAAPHLIDSETTHALRRMVTSGRLSARQGNDAFQFYRRLAIRRWPATQLLGRMWELRANLSGYDATYVALAEALQEPLLTTDRRLASAPGLTCRIEVV